MKRATFEMMDFAAQKAAQNKGFVEAAVELLLERRIERVLRNEFEKIGFDCEEAGQQARWYAAKLHDCGHIGVTSDKMLAIYAGNNFDDDDIIDEDAVYGD